MWTLYSNWTNRLVEFVEIYLNFFMFVIIIVYWLSNVFMNWSLAGSCRSFVLFIILSEV